MGGSFLRLVKLIGGRAKTFAINEKSKRRGGKQLI